MSWGITSDEFMKEQMNPSHTHRGLFRVTRKKLEKSMFQKLRIKCPPFLRFVDVQSIMPKKKKNRALKRE